MATRVRFARTHLLSHASYSPLLGPSVSGSFAAMLAILLTILAGNDGSGSFFSQIGSAVK